MTMPAARAAFSLCVVALAASGCGRAAQSVPLLLVGIDGGEWSVVRALWEQDRLPTLRALAARGSSAELRTAYGPSPVIWTTMATGLVPAEHGITDFVVATPRGDVPVSSTLRRAPALWNMLSERDRRVAVLGWWATWPAETVRGVVVSDRYGLTRDGAVAPPEFAQRVAALEGLDARDGAGRFASLATPGEVGARDRTMAVVAHELVGARERYDLVLLYFRGVDVVSHGAWKYWRPERFPPIAAAELEARREDVPRAYEAVDRALGRVLEAAGGLDRINVLVVSDHGFRAQVPEEVGFFLDFDRVLERLGFLVRSGDGVDREASLAWTVASPHHERTKKVRLAPPGRAATQRRLESELGRVAFADGRPAFRLRAPRPSEAAEGADTVAVVEDPAVPGSLRLDGAPWPESGWSVWAVSGTHRPRTHGLLIAAGPDLARGADLGRVSIHDVAPTVLYALGLPYGRDFAGRPVAALFTAEFRARTPLRAIDTWGRRAAGGPADSPADGALLEQLRALGYLDG
jgi:predicted AlkP superfamily phosphohydrolase/phosphomutase